jgi:hypothetical protein
MKGGNWWKQWEDSENLFNQLPMCVLQFKGSESSWGRKRKKDCDLGKGQQRLKQEVK